MESSQSAIPMSATYVGGHVTIKIHRLTSYVPSWLAPDPLDIGRKVCAESAH